MPTGVQHHQVARARKPAAENPQTALVNLVVCGTDQPN
jgi:hypothetical protein